jgi:hypothetical protein
MRILVRISFLLFVFCKGVFAQVPVGDWKVHVPFSNTIDIAIENDKVYCAANSGIFVYDLDDNSISTLTKQNGLNDVGISAMAYEPESEIIIVGYNNGNIDLVVNNVVTNLPDLERSILQTSKKINNILIHDELAYLSCDFGIIVVDVVRREIKETYFIGEFGSFEVINEVAVLNDTIYAATENGIKAGSFSRNLSDFQSWFDASPVSLSEDAHQYNSIVVFDNALYTNYKSAEFDQDTLFVRQNGNWTKFASDMYSNQSVTDINAFENRLCVSLSFFAWIFDEDWNMTENIYTYGDDLSSPEPLSILVYNDEYWIADRRQGLVHRPGPFTHQLIAPSGPPSSSFFELAFRGDELWVASGSVTARWGNNNQYEGLYKYANNQWTQYRSGGLDSIQDIVNIAINPFNTSEIYGGSWGKGLFKTLEGTLTEVYRENNSTVNSIDLFPFYAIGDIAFDKNGVLWATNSGLPGQRIVDPLVAFDGEDWYEFRLSNFPDNQGHVNELIIDRNGYKWMTSYVNGVIVYDDNGTLADENDDRVVHLTTGEGEGNLPSLTVFDLAEDQNGIIWLCSDEGLAIIQSPISAFDNGGVDAEKIIIEDGENFEYLLEGQALSCIHIDAANRKWIGTYGGGVYLISADGQETIYHFTSKNSPLLSDDILDININPQTGEVYFATSEGLVTYNANSTDGEVYDGPTYAFPNPVPPGFEGTIGIRGLPNNGEVKITDITGNLVYETFAEGGSANWDGNDLSGRKVQSGVYLVMASNTDGSNTVITKILFIRGQ